MSNDLRPLTKSIARLRSKRRRTLHQFLPPYPYTWRPLMRMNTKTFWSSRQCYSTDLRSTAASSRMFCVRNWATSMNLSVPRSYIATEDMLRPSSAATTALLPLKSYSNVSRTSSTVLSLPSSSLCWKLTPKITSTGLASCSLRYSWCGYLLRRKEKCEVHLRLQWKGWELLLFYWESMWIWRRSACCTWIPCSGATRSCWNREMPARISMRSWQLLEASTKTNFRTYYSREQYYSSYLGWLPVDREERGPQRRLMERKSSIEHGDWHYVAVPWASEGEVLDL